MDNFKRNSLKAKSKIIRDLINRHKLSDRKFAESVGLAPEQVSRYLKGSNEPTVKTLEKIRAVYPEFEYESILTKIDKVHEPGIPYYDIEASAGPTLVFNDKQEIPASYINIPGFEDCNFWINCFGDSMYPKYCAGEIIACKEVEKKFVAFGEAFLIRLKDGNRYIKFIRKNQEKGRWTLVSENENYDPFDVSIDDVTNVWIIKGKIKKNMI